LSPVLKIRGHPFFCDQIDGAGGPVLAIEFGVFAAQAFFALINVIFCTPMGGLP
jgi:hypothetical protein